MALDMEDSHGNVVFHLALHIQTIGFVIAGIVPLHGNDTLHHGAGQAMTYTNKHTYKPL